MALDLCVFWTQKNPRCLLIEGKYEEHSNRCDNLDEAKCAKNIPNDNEKKSVLLESSSICNSVDRMCNEYKIYTDRVGTSVRDCSNSF